MLAPAPLMAETPGPLRRPPRPLTPIPSFPQQAYFPRRSPTKQPQDVETATKTTTQPQGLETAKEARASTTPLSPHRKRNKKCKYVLIACRTIKLTMCMLILDSSIFREKNLDLSLSNARYPLGLQSRHQILLRLRLRGMFCLHYILRCIR